MFCGVLKQLCCTPFYHYQPFLCAVRSNVKKLNNTFVALKNAIQSELEDPKDGREAVSVSDAVNEIMASQTVSRNPHKKKFLKNKMTLRSSKNIRLHRDQHQSVLDCLGLEWDYLNPDIYENLINDFSLHSLDEQLAEYRAELQQFMDEMPVAVFNTMMGQKRQYKKIPKGFKELVTNHNWKSPVYLKDVDEFRQSVAAEYGLRQCTVLLVALGTPLVTISLVVPFTIESLIKSTKPEFFKKHNITKMTYNGSLVTSEVSISATSASGIVCYAACTMQLLSSDA